MTVEAQPGPRLPTVCPFVAFTDERDLRSGGPDHRHRCYAETPPAPRALAHQARYCLSPTFTECPIFQDWAAREAARPSERPAPLASPVGEDFFAERPTSAPAPVARERDGYAAAPSADLDEDVEPEAATAVREWERVRPRRDYPRLGPSRGVPPALIGLAVLAVAAVALFLLPSVLRGLFSGGTPASPSAVPSGSGSPTASAAVTASPLPTPTPGPTPLVYVVKSGDTLTRIANQFDVTVQQILAANPTITNPNDIKVGQNIVIPTASPSPGASATGSSPP
jgi:LysM repeat protein